MAIKRVFDVSVSLVVLLISAPILLPLLFIIVIEDFGSPLFCGARVGKNGKPFKMFKLRTMRVGSHLTGVDSTAADDPRITFVGAILRRYKLDEIPQVLNVLMGDMSIVGPRPNVESEVKRYTVEEFRMLDLKPGVIDLASIVFADEGEILEGSPSPDLAYNQFIRPYKSRLALAYVDNRSFPVDCLILALLALRFISHANYRRLLLKLGRQLKVDESIEWVLLRERDLIPMPPPGSTEIVYSLD